MTALLVIAILVLLIVVHELGHFIAAKISRVKVQEFGVGYPPRAFTFGKLGDTEYTFNWIPFGGFVRLFGDEGEEEHGRGSLVDSPRWKQALILVAGVAMNAIAAWGLFAIALHLGVPHVVESPREGETTRVLVSDVVAGSPAEVAGIAAGDEITDIADADGIHAIPATPDSFVAFVRAHAGKSLVVSYKHKGIEDQTTMIPAQGVLSKAAGQPALGVALALVANRSLPWKIAAREALSQTVNGFAVVVRDLGALATTLARGAPNLSGVVGPVGIVSYVGEASQSGIGAVLELAALISINLAIINLIPIPALDGGRLVILAIESAMRKSAPRLAIQTLNALGVALIIFLMITVTYHDIARLLV
jgi:regulator of sigma E protease